VADRVGVKLGVPGSKVAEGVGVVVVVPVEVAVNVGVRV
jgi:hypothetical protein